MTVPYRWVIVFLGGLMGCVAIGAMFSLAVFLEPMSAETGWSRAGISTAMTLDFLIMGVAGFLWGAASDRYGPRPWSLIGAVLLGPGLVVASRATTPLTFQLGFGLLVGLSAGAFFAPMIAAVTGWFDTQRGARRQPRLRRHGHGADDHDALRRLADLDPRLAHGDGRHGRPRLGAPDPGRPLRPPAARGAPSRDAAGEPAGEADAGRALRSPQFLILGGTFFLCCAAHAGPIFHMLSYAIFCGIPTMAAVSIYSVEGLAGLGGRLLFGVAADRSA